MAVMLKLIDTPQLRRGENWRELALCSQTDPELFFPLGKSHESKKQERKAKQICMDCPVVNQCLRWAIDNRHEEGVWGGLGEDERRQLILRDQRRVVRRSF